MKASHINSSEFLEEIKREILQETIYVFTPKGDVIQLPRGSTAIDFAYHIHTEVGNHISGAKADGLITPIKEPLRNTQVIEIQTNINSHPRLHWLQYTHTARARSKIRAWLNKHDTNLIIHRNIVAKNLPKAAHTIPKQSSQKKNAKSAMELFTKQKVAVTVNNHRKILIHFAACCNPHIGDDIIGYVSQSRGIIIHHPSCPNLRNISELKERLIDVAWEVPKLTYHFRISARPTRDLFGEIEKAIHIFHAHLVAGRVHETPESNIEAFVSLELMREKDLQQITKHINEIPAVISITKQSAAPH